MSRSFSPYICAAGRGPKANPAEARALALEFYKQGGLEVNERAMEQEFTLRPTFSLDEQLKIMSRAGGASTVDGWFTEIGKFLVDVGTVPANPATKDFITDEFLKQVAADPKLRSFSLQNLTRNELPGRPRSCGRAGWSHAVRTR